MALAFKLEPAILFRCGKAPQQARTAGCDAGPFHVYSKRMAAQNPESPRCRGNSVCCDKDAGPLAASLPRPRTRVRAQVRAARLWASSRRVG